MSKYDDIKMCDCGLEIDVCRKLAARTARTANLEVPDELRYLTAWRRARRAARQSQLGGGR